MRQDILILGAGPAGLSTALHLARLAPLLAPRLLILEKAHHPRPKLCGGALTGDAEAILQALGLDVSEVTHVDAGEAHFDYAGRGLNITFRGTHTLRMIRRDEFDAWLAAKVRLGGIEIREGVTVHRVEPGRDVVLVHTDAGTFEAAIVVGADGSNGITRRSILPDAPIHTARALEVLVPAVDAAATERLGRSNLDLPSAPSAAKSSTFSMSPEERDAGGCFPPASLSSGSTPLRGTRGRGRGWGQNQHQANVAYFDFAPVTVGIAGYTWDFPTQVNGTPMRCWGIYDTNLLADGARPPLRRPLADEMNRFGADLESVEIQGHPIRWFSSRSALSVPRVILVGDAAGADGIFGEGISMALGYGMVAAEAICDAVGRDDYSFVDYRLRMLRSPLGHALTIRTAITHILYRLRWAWFQRLFWQGLRPIVKAVSFAVVLNWAKRMKWPGSLT